MNSRTLIMVTFSAVFFVPVALRAQGRSSWLSAAVDAKGVRHRGSEDSGLAPWMTDAVKTVNPDYAYRERALGQQGSGLLRLTLDLKTGLVTKVAVVKSTGYPALDDSATNAFRKWRWKPGKWKEIDVPVTFTISRRSSSSEPVSGPPFLHAPTGAPRRGGRP